MISSTVATDAGNYQVIVTNTFGSVTSAVAQLAVLPPLPRAPFVSSTSERSGVPPGGEAFFSVAPLGTPPFVYQWSFDGTNLVGQTNSSLTVPNVQASGDYQVNVSNSLGGVVIGFPFTIGIPPLVLQSPQLSAPAPGMFNFGWNALIGQQYLQGLKHEVRRAREFLRNADPVLARLIDARPDFRPGAWKEALPPLDAFGTLVFQVAGQQLSVASTRAIIAHLEERFGGHMPSAGELLAADPQVLRDSGFSVRKGQTLRALAQRFVDGRLSDEALASMSDEEVESALTEVPGIGPWSARGFLLVALDRPDVYLTGDIALRRAIQRAYGFDHIPTEAELAQISDRWRPYRSLAVSYLFASEYDG